MQKITFRAMGCEMAAMIDADTEDAQAELAHVPAWFEQWEDSLSRFRPDSELNRLNRSGGKWFAASETLWQVLRRAQLAERRTHGIVTPVVFDAMLAIGYDRSFDLLEKQGVTTEVSTTSKRDDSAMPPTKVRRGTSMDNIALDAAQRRARLPAGMHLDFGGIAKGWAADMAARRLSRFGPALVDAGGDVATSQPQSDGNGWPISLDNPLEPDTEKHALVVLDGGGVATSGRDYRRWQRGGRSQHHIINPRTGQPAETDVLIASVIGPSAADAEIAAKVALILDSIIGMAWIEAHHEFAAQLILENGQVLQSTRLDAYLWKPSN